MGNNTFIGIDFGTDCVRAILVDEHGSPAPRHDQNLVAFIADLHVNGTAEGKPGEDCHQTEYLRKTVAEILTLDPLPANVVCCGDIAFLFGLPQDYALAKTILQPLCDAGIRVTLGMGDHATLKLKQNDWFGERGPGSGGVFGKAFVGDRSDCHATIPLD